MEKTQKLLRMFAVFSITFFTSVASSNIGMKHVTTQKMNFALESTIRQYKVSEGKPYIIKLFPDTKKVETTALAVTSPVNTPTSVSKTEISAPAASPAASTSTDNSIKTSSSTTTKKIIVVASRGGSAPAVSTSSVAIANGQKAANYAAKYIGSRYVSGGASPSGFDCSGFTSYIYNCLGVSLPRTAAGQASIGTSVSASQLKPGDLVFFQTHSNGISHVGMYIGGGRFVHAANPGKGVTVSSLGESYYASRFKGAKRIFK